MAEGFKVEPAHVAGYGLYLWDVYSYLSSIGGFVQSHGRADSRYRGLVGMLSGTANANADSVVTKIRDVGNATVETAAALKKAAWVYSGAEETAYTEFDEMGERTGYKEFPDPAPYHQPWRPDGGTPTEPVYKPADIEDVFDMEGVIGMLNDFVRWLIGFDPMAALGELISGDWGALTYTGDVMTEAGEHLGAAAVNLQEKLPMLRQHWQGQAAENFEHFSTQLGAAVDGIGPVAELFGGMFRVLAHVIEFAAQAIKDLIQAFADKLTNLNFFGVLGKLWDLAEAIITAFTDASDLYELCKELIEGAKAVGGLAVDYLNNANPEALAQISGRADGFASSLRSGADRLGKASDYGHIIAQGASEYLGSVQPAIDEMGAKPLAAPPAPYDIGTPEGTTPPR